MSRSSKKPRVGQLLGKAIRGIRHKRKLTQQAVADQLGVSLRRWQSLEQGQNVRLDTLFRVAQVLSVKPEMLIRQIHQAGSEPGLY